MPERSGFELCSCSECLATNSTGVWFSRARIWGHLAAVEARAAAQIPTDTSLSQSVESQILLQTMLDQGSDQLDWNRPGATHDSSDVQTTDPQDAHPLPVDQIMLSIQRLADGNTTASVPPSGPARTKVEKRERHRNTQKALERLAKLESQIFACRTKLLESSMSTQALRSLKTDIDNLFRMVQGVTRRSHLVDEKKTIILGQLRELDSLHAQKCKLFEGIEGLPVDFDSGMWSYFIYHVSR